MYDACMYACTSSACMYARNEILANVYEYAMLTPSISINWRLTPRVDTRPGNTNPTGVSNLKQVTSYRT